MIVLNTDLEHIKCLLYDLYRVEHEKYEYEFNRNKLKCENWDTYDKDYDELLGNVSLLKESIVESCNDYVEYPVFKFLCFDFTDSVKFKDDNLLRQDYLSVPKVDKREYYCLVSLLDSLVDDIFMKFHGDYYIK